VRRIICARRCFGPCARAPWPLLGSQNVLPLALGSRALGAVSCTISLAVRKAAEPTGGSLQTDKQTQRPST
jgi:hypothetical protein